MLLNNKEGLPLNIKESTIRYAMENSNSNKSAAKFLKISYNSYKKYAKMYIDEESGKSLFDLHKNQEGRGVRKGSYRVGSYKKLEQIISGHYPDFPPDKLKRRLLKEGMLEEKCSRCGFEERRVLDYSVPLLLNWIDGDKKNHRLDNLEFLCYNCYFLTVDNVVGKRLDLDEL